MLAVIVAAFAFWALMQYRKKIEEKRLLFEAQKQILDKLGSGQEAIQFLASKEGRELFERLNPPVNHITGAGWKPGTRTPIAVVKETATWGLLLLGAGAGIIVSDRFYAQTGFLAYGWISALAGIGLLIAALISYHLSKKWEIIAKKNSEI